MRAKWLLFLRPFLVAVLTHFAAFSTLAHVGMAHNRTTSDHLALLAIKSMIKDDPQGVMTSWNHSGSNFCQWQGVTCSARHQRVTLLDLSSGGLIGTLSPSIGNLSFLKGIMLFNNSFSGDIPPEIGRLFRLQELRLFDNFFTGNIPTTIKNCSNLQVLHLGFNNLAGKIPDGIGSLSVLNVLILHVNTLEGGIPSFIANLTLLETLSLGYCQLGGSIPNIFQQLKNLKRLAVVGNNLVGTIPPSFYNCSSLEEVYMDLNNLTGSLRLDLVSSTMLHLESLALSGNRLTYLDISNASISSPMANLMHLDISNNHIHGSLNSLGVLAKLRVINIGFNEFSGSLDGFLCSSGVKDAQGLNFRNNHFSGVIPECWEKWPNLEFLNLEDNNLFGEIPRTLGGVSSLQLLNVGGNLISGRLPYSLKNLSKLKILQLGGNKLVGRVPTWIGTKLTSLRILSLRSNNFYGKLPNHLCHLSHTHILDLAHNNLSGNVPKCFNNFSVLSGVETNLEAQFSFSYESWSLFVVDSFVIKGREDAYRAFQGLVTLLDLSSNNFSGNIPSELTTLKELKSLNLSRNQLTGKIPNMIGDMKALESFDVSVNKLSGELPVSLSKLNFLSSFNASYNNLIGRVPTSTQIQSFNESSFFGNKLCGAPLTNGCVTVQVPHDHTTADQKEDNEPHGADWGLIISIVLGFVTGFWILMTSLIVSRSWRIAYFRRLGKVANVRYVVYDVTHKYCCNMFPK